MMTTYQMNAKLHVFFYEFLEKPFISKEAGLTGGTKFEVRYAERLGKEVYLHWENSGVQRTHQNALPFGNEEKTFSDGWLKFFSEALI